MSLSYHKYTDDIESIIWGKGKKKRKKRKLYCWYLLSYQNNLPTSSLWNWRRGWRGGKGVVTFNSDKSLSLTTVEFTLHIENAGSWDDWHADLVAIALPEEGIIGSNSSV